MRAGRGCVDVTSCGASSGYAGRRAGAEGSSPGRRRRQRRTRAPAGGAAGAARRRRPHRPCRASALSLLAAGHRQARVSARPIVLRRLAEATAVTTTGSITAAPRCSHGRQLVDRAQSFLGRRERLAAHLGLRTDHRKNEGGVEESRRATEVSERTVKQQAMLRCGARSSRRTKSDRSSRWRTRASRIRSAISRRSRASWSRATGRRSIWRKRGRIWRTLASS